MKRFIITCLLTIIIGMSIFVIYSFLSKEKDQDESQTEQESVEENYEFDISYAKQISTEELENILNKEGTTFIFIGRSTEDATKKVSTILRSIEKIDSLNFYYLEKDEIDNTTLYQDLPMNYPDISNYINFTPVILAFRNNQFLGGLPGEVKSKNVVNFLNYIETLE